MPLADPRAEERVGSVLHEKWTLERLLGVGGMGAVYAARHRNGARAAVKVLSAAMGRLPHIRGRFLREGYAANRVEHAGAVKVLDDDVIQEGPDEGTAYLVMELLDGESLHERAKREPALTERDLLEVADGVLAVLDAAHTNGVVHRDLKPDNLFLAQSPDREGTHIKVLDFGLARLLEAQEQTIAGMALGTPTYMSPEQAAGHVADIDGRTDIYALGCILFQLASKQRVHDAAHTLGLVVRMATTPAPKLRTLAPDASEAFANVVDRALAFKREDRYPTAAAMRVDVQAALAMLPADTSTLNVVAGSQPPPAAGPPPSAPRMTAPLHAALAPTVRVPVGAVSEALQEPSRAPSSAPPPPADTSAFSRTILLAVAAACTGFALWWNLPALQKLMPTLATAAPAAAPVPSPVPSASIEPAPAPSAAPSSSQAPPSTLIEDAGAEPLAEELDASFDGGDEEEEDDEEEELDASVEAGVPATPAVAKRPHPAAKHPPKKRAPRRPGAHPRRRRRWHY